MSSDLLWRCKTGLYICLYKWNLERNNIGNAYNCIFNKNYTAFADVRGRYQTRLGQTPHVTIVFPGPPNYYRHERVQTFYITAICNTPSYFRQPGPDKNPPPTLVPKTLPETNKHPHTRFSRAHIAPIPTSQILHTHTHVHTQRHSHTNNT